MRTLGIVPARGGSKGIPDKNLRLVGPRTLLEHAVDCGLDAGLDVVVTTDSQEIADAVRERPVTVRRRPARLATDTSPMMLTLLDAWHSLENWDQYEAICLLQPTSPLRRPGHVRDALSMLEDAPAVISCTRTDGSALKAMTLSGGRLEPLTPYAFAARQTAPEVLQPNGAIYAARALHYRRGEWCPKATVPYIMAEHESVDIDDWEDLERANRLWQLRDR